MEHTAKERQTVTAADVGTLDAGALAREVPNPVVGKAQPMRHKGEPKTVMCRILDHDPATKYVYTFSWPKLGADGTLGSVTKTVMVPAGGEPTFKVAVPPGAEVTLTAPACEPVKFRAQDGITHGGLMVAWVG